MKATPSTGEHAEMQFPSLRIGGASRQKVPRHQHHPETSTNIRFHPSNRAMGATSPPSAQNPDVTSTIDAVSRNRIMIISLFEP
jgi:hypothetical protein